MQIPVQGAQHRRRRPDFKKLDFFEQELRETHSTMSTPQTMGQQHGRRSWAEPWKIKMVEPLEMRTRAEREAAAQTGDGS